MWRGWTPDQVRGDAKASLVAADRAADRDCVHRRRIAALLHGEHVIGRLHERDRVHGATVDPHLIVEVVAGRTAGRAHAADLLAAGHVLTLVDEDRGHVAIAGRDAAAVVELDQITVAATVPAGAKNGAVGRRV